MFGFLAARERGARHALAAEVEARTRRPASALELTGAGLGVGDRSAAPRRRPRAHPRALRPVDT